MNNLKKLALMSAVVMSVGMLSGCGDEKTAEPAGKDKSSSQVQEEKDTAESSGTAYEDLTRGTVENGVYTNDFAGIKLTAPEGWEFANDEYIASMMNIGLDVVGKGDEFTKTLLDQTTIYDTVCIEQSTGKNVIIMFENLAKEVPDPEKFTVDDYLDQVDEQFKTIDSVNYTKNGGKETVMMGGNEYVRQAYYADYPQLENKICQVYYVRKAGKYMLGVIMSSGNTEDDMTVYEGNFS